MAGNLILTSSNFQCMKKYYKISIPQPCDEKWGDMIPDRNGRFCDSCKKTVIDFTNLSEMEVHDFLNKKFLETSEIFYSPHTPTLSPEGRGRNLKPRGRTSESYLDKNQDHNICGRFRKTQLDSIKLTIPVEIIKQSYSFRKAFLLAIVIAMGSTLLSCTNPDGNQQKIDSVEIIDQKHTNPLTKTTCGTTSEKDSLETIEGEVMIMGLIAPTPSSSYELIPFAALDEFPSFPKVLEKNRSKENFQKELREFFSEEFITTIGNSIGLVGTHRIYTQFEINTEGIVENIKIRASHPIFEKEARRVLKKLPKFEPGSYQNKKVVSLYSLPIVFKIEE